MSPYPILRYALLIDALVSGSFGVLIAVAGAWLQPWLGLPTALLFWVGLALLPYALFLFVLARRPTLGCGIVRLVIGLNILWVIDSVALLVSGWVAPTLLGMAFVLAQALVVAGFAGLQAYGLRRSLDPLPRVSAA